MISVLFEGWRLLQHSYGNVLAFLLVHLWKQYGPNKTDEIIFYVRECSYCDINWKNKQKLTYSPEYNRILKILKPYNGEKVDIIYRQTYPYNLEPPQTPTPTTTPVCVFYTSEFAVLNNSYFHHDPKQDIRNYLIKNPNFYFTAPSEWSARGMTPYLEDKTRNKVISHGVDTSIFYRHSNNSIRQQIRRKYNILDTDILLINIGAMTMNKGIFLILEALHHLVNIRKMPFKLLLKGMTDLYKSREFVDSYINHLGYNTTNLKSHIIFVDGTLNYDEINDLFNSADLYISPYLAEGFGLTMLEALASGLRVLVPRTGSASDYIDPIYKNGGESYIYYVDSVVIQDGAGLYKNQIDTSSIINILSKNISNIKTTLDDKTYLLLKKYIKKNYSWYKISTDLYNYFRDIIVQK
jgi:glycosyltransferase involved in cell wall biosynthesis